MKTYFRVPLACTLGIGGLITLLVAFGPPSARAESSATSRTWELVPSPSVPGVGQGLWAVTAISATDAWAVGDVYNQALGDQQTLTQHWDGTRWQTVSSPSRRNAYNHLTGVSGTSSNDVWAVGYTIDDRTYAWQALILHWDGSKWSIVRGAALGTGYNALTRVVALAPNDVWAVGYNGTDIVFHTLAEHWDGHSWSVVSTPAPGTYDALYGVTATSANDVWAVGYYKEGDFTYESLTLHWNGTAWAEVESPNTTAYNWFNGVTAPGSNDVWSIGYEYEDGGNAIAHPLIQHWNGTGWSVVDNPQVPDGHYTNLSDAAWISSTDVVAVGTSTDARDNYDPLIEQWDGIAWTQAAVPEMRGMPTTQVLAVAADKAGGYWAVGWAQRESPLTFKNYIARRSP
ncbi:MAG TPA: hypothetical protein VIW21_02285 [Chthoniobacterales bacterium]